ncbi:Tyr recombinase domain-containing protein [Streptococcus pluranimalium]|uniref:tyrosine-type recombinase/integrase n=1 Tax=Streptococcus pluranimalium TaxID=82348 RepID=UPI0039EC443B
MASIIKVGKKYKVQISLFKNGQQKKLIKRFNTKAEAELWALEMELEKGKGKQLSTRETYFPEFFEDWLYLIKQKDVRESTFYNYTRALKEIKLLFHNIKLKDLNDVVVQQKIDHYSKTHSKKTAHELLLKIKTALRYAYAKGYIHTDFLYLVKARGKTTPKRNKALSITDFTKLRKYLLNHTDSEFNILALLALETGMRRGELLGIKPKDLFEYGIRVRRSISPNSSDTLLKTENSKRDVSINSDIYHLLKKIPTKSNGYIFETDNFRQAYRLKQLLKKLELPETTFHGLRDTHASFLFSKGIDIVYVSKRLGHCNIQTTQNYYLELMPEKKHQQDADALNLLASLSNEEI